VILRPKSPNRSCRFRDPNRETRATDFEAKLEKIVATGFEAKPVKTVRVVLRPNHSQTVDLGFVAQPRNPCTSSPRARCRPHTAPPDLLITRPPCTDLCDHPQSSAPGLLLLPRSSSLHAMPHLHSTRQANEILQTKQR
jgi:hypothetical protein